MSLKDEFNINEKNIILIKICFSKLSLKFRLKTIANMDPVLHQRNTSAVTTDATTQKS